jgi:hypothetical protein
VHARLEARVARLAEPALELVGRDEDEPVLPGSSQ